MTKELYYDHHLLGLFVALFGFVFLLGNLGYIDQRTMGIIWPLFVIVVGLKLLFVKA